MRLISADYLSEKFIALTYNYFLIKYATFAPINFRAIVVNAAFIINIKLAAQVTFISMLAIRPV